MNRQPFEIPPKWWAPKLAPWAVKLTRGYRHRQLRRAQRVVHIEAIGLDYLERAIKSDQGVLITPNHSAHYDSAALYAAADQIGQPLYFMTAWQVFAMSRGWDRWLMQRLGCFSIDRESTDRKAFKQAVNILQGEPQPLVIFPEGDVYHVSDRVTPFREGAAAVALALLVRQKRGDQGAMASAVQTALASGGVIILITAAGSGFGGVLQQTNIADRIEELAKHYDMSGLMLLPLVFLTTAVIRTAQGSATVAMITSVGIFAGMATSLPFHPVYLAMAIGCGSKPFPWMNDSGFWVINRMSGITLGESFRSVSFLMTVMAVDGLIVVMLLAWLFPMAN